MFPHFISATMHDSFETRYRRILESIQTTAEACGRSPQSIRLVGVSKKHPEALIREAHRAGLTIIGENRFQEAEQKYSTLQDLNLEWHFIGGIQTNKLKKTIHVFDLYHGVDRPKVIHALQKEASQVNRNVDVLFQVNIGEEENKHGSSRQELDTLFEAGNECPNVRCLGLMAIPPYCENPEDVRPYFRCMKSLSDQYQREFDCPAHEIEISMGMSHDYPVAIQEGATLIRIGTALFGQRPT